MFYSGRLDEYFGEEYGRLVYELHSYETELRFQKHYQKHMQEKVLGKNLKDGVPGMLEGTEKNRMLF